MATDAKDAGEGKEGKPTPPVLLECGFYDVEQVKRLTQALMVTLAKACMEKTSGYPFSQREAVVPDVKKEFLDYLNQESEDYATGGGAWSSQDKEQVSMPSKIVEDMFENFIKLKKSLFSRVSSMIIDVKRTRLMTLFMSWTTQECGWLGGERMIINQVTAKALLKRIDRSKTFHCEMKFESMKDLADHQSTCFLRPMTCPNDGCGAIYSAMHVKPHDASCSYKLLPCEFQCECLVRRGEMQTHCTTVCPMKKMNCPYHPVGCLHVMPQSLLEQHCTEYMGQHLLETLQHVHNHESTLGNHAQRIILVEKALQQAQRSEAVDIRTVQLTVKEQESKVKLLEAEVKKLRADLKALDVSSELLQLKHELRNLQNE